MPGLQICCHKVCISPRHLKRAVPEHLLQMEHGPAAPQVVHRECVAECVERAAWRIESEFAAKQLHIPQDIPTSQFRLRAVGEEQMVRRAIRFLAVPAQRFPQLENEGDNSLLAALAIQRHNRFSKSISLTRKLRASVMRQPAPARLRLAHACNAAQVPTASAAVWQSVSGPGWPPTPTTAPVR